MLFFPSTNDENIRNNVLILHSLFLASFGLYILISLIVTGKLTSAIIYTFIASGFLLIGLGSLLLAKKKKRGLSSILFLALFTFLCFVYFTTADQTMSTPALLAGFMGLIIVTNIVYGWKFGLPLTVFIILLAVVRFYLISTSQLSIIVTNNPVAFVNINFVMVTIYSCLMGGYYASAIQLLVKKRESSTQDLKENFESKTQDFLNVATSLERIDMIFQKQASQINDTVLNNAEILSLNSTASYDDLLRVSSELAKAIDEVTLKINEETQGKGSNS